MEVNEMNKPISIRVETKDRLDCFKRFRRETYDEVINRLVDYARGKSDDVMVVNDLLSEVDTGDYDEILDSASVQDVRYPGERSKDVVYDKDVSSGNIIGKVPVSPSHSSSSDLDPNDGEVPFPNPDDYSKDPLPDPDVDKNPLDPDYDEDIEPEDDDADLIDDSASGEVLPADTEVISDSIPKEEEDADARPSNVNADGSHNNRI